MKSNIHSIYGRALSEVGQPVNSIDIILRRIRSKSDVDESLLSMRTVTDSRGAFRFDGLAAGEYAISAIRAYWPSDIQAPERLVLAGEDNVLLVVRPDGIIKGRVLLENKPLERFGIILHRNVAIPIGTLSEVANVTGEFCLSTLAGQWAISIRGLETRLWRRDRIEVEANGLLELGDIHLKRARTLLGQVVDSSGSPLSNSTVTIGYSTRGANLSRNKWPFWYRIETLTDSAGRFCATGIDSAPDARASLCIWATHPVHGSSRIRELPAEGQMATLVVVGCGCIRGSITGKQRVATNKVVYASNTDEPARIRAADVDLEGEFRFDDVPWGEYVLSLGSHQLPEGCSVSVAVQEGQTLKVALPTPSPGVCVELRRPGGASPRPRLVAIDGSGNTLVAKQTVELSSQVVNYFFGVPPGGYHVVEDNQICGPFFITEVPSEQVIVVEPKQTKSGE